MKAKTLKRLMQGTAKASGLVAIARMLTRHSFNVVGFHGVSLADEHLRFPTLFISPETFERRLRFLTRRYRIVSLDEAVAQHRRGRIEPRQVVLTFDDGFYNFLAGAVPLLQQYNAPATVYMVTSEVESGAPIFNLLAKDLVLSSKRTQVGSCADDRLGGRDLATPAARESVALEAASALRDLLDAEARMAYCSDLAGALDVDIQPKLAARLWDRLTEPELRQVVAAGFDAQLHTHSHRNVVDNPGVVRQEVGQNRRSLERMIGRPATHFCYPLGLWQKSVWPDLRAEGVESAVTTRNGPNFPATPVLSLRRYLTGEAMSDSEFEFALSGARWLATAAARPRTRWAPSEKRLRYSQQPELY